MNEGLQLSPSLEDYLEAILELEEKQDSARVKEIAARLSVQMPSVTGALRSLQRKGLINYAPNAPVVLTPSGQEAASRIREKHRILLVFFRDILFLPADLAESTGCRMEHILSGETTKKFRSLTNYLKKQLSSEELKGIIEET